MTASNPKNFLNAQVMELLDRERNGPEERQTDLSCFALDLQIEEKTRIVAVVVEGASQSEMAPV